jgi:hypothetical protein
MNNLIRPSPTIDGLNERQHKTIKDAYKYLEFLVDKIINSENSLELNTLNKINNQNKNNLDLSCLEESFMNET